MRVKSIAPKIVASLLLALILGCSAGPMGAPRAEAASGKGTLSLVCSVERDGATVLLSGDEYSIAKVATADVEADGSVAYATDAAFAQFDCDWGSLSASDLSRKAELLQRFAFAGELYAQSSVTDARGRASFGQLDPGLYLVSRTDVAGKNADYVTTPFLVSVPTTVGGALSWAVEAHPKFEYDVVKIRPSNVTIYMGGNDGYENVDGAEGGKNDSLPIPMYVIEAPDGVDPEDIVFEDVATGGQWAPVLIGHDEEGNPCYRLDRLNGQAEEVKVSYITADGTSISQDEFTPRIEQELYKLYGIEITESDRRTVMAHAGDRSYAVSAGGAVLTVRAVDDESIAGNASNPVTGVLTSISAAGAVPSEVGYVVAPQGTYFTLNETDVVVDDLRDPSGTEPLPRVGLLFDSIINDVYDRESALEDKVDEAMPEVAEGATRHYQSKYLDLVDMADGNAWVTASNPVEVYWGYPEGTDQSTEFSLWHFKGLHRDGTDDPGESGYDLEDIEQVDPEQVTIENTPQGIKFTVPSGGFSPFVLVWEDAGGSPVVPGGGIPSEWPWSGLLPQTGEQVAALLVPVLLAAALIAFLAARRMRKKGPRA